MPRSTSPLPPDVFSDISPRSSDLLPVYSPLPPPSQPHSDLDPGSLSQGVLAPPQHQYQRQHHSHAAQPQRGPEEEGDQSVQAGRIIAGWELKEKDRQKRRDDAFVIGQGTVDRGTTPNAESTELGCSTRPNEADDAIPHLESRGEEHEAAESGHGVKGDDDDEDDVSIPSTSFYTTKSQYTFASLTPTSSIQTSHPISSQPNIPPLSSLARHIDHVVAAINPTTMDESLDLANLPAAEKIVLLRGLTLVDHKLRLASEARGQELMKKEKTKHADNDEEEEEEVDSQEEDAHRNKTVIQTSDSTLSPRLTSCLDRTTTEIPSSTSAILKQDVSSRPLSYGHPTSKLRHSPSDISLQTLHHHHPSSARASSTSSPVPPRQQLSPSRLINFITTPLDSPSPTRSTIRRSHARSLLYRGAVAVAASGESTVRDAGTGSKMVDVRSSFGSFYTAADGTWKGSVFIPSDGSDDGVVEGEERGGKAVEEGGEGGKEGGGGVIGDPAERGGDVLLRFFEQQQQVYHQNTSSTPFQTSTSQVFPSMDEESLDEYYDDGTPWVLFTSEIVSPSSSTTSSPAGTPFTCRGEERNAARGRYWGVGGYFVVPTEPIVGAWTVVEWVVGAKWRENDKCVKGEENGGGLL